MANSTCTNGYIEDGYAITHYMAGKQNRPSFYPNQTSRDGMSHLWRGPAFYTRELRRYIKLDETSNPSNLPSDVSEMATLRTERSPTKVPAAIQALSPGDTWNRRWTGSGFYSPDEHTWTREAVSIGIPSDSRLIINEEDWLKYKFMCSHPSLESSGSVPNSQTGSRPGSASTGPKFQKTKPIIYEEHLNYYMS